MDVIINDALFKDIYWHMKCKDWSVQKVSVTAHKMLPQL